MTREITSIEDLEPDDRNANRGTDSGRSLLDSSISDLGAGRSIVADCNGIVIAGNKTLEAARAAKLPIEVVRTAGDRLVVVQREDLDLADVTGKARRLAYVDNRAGELGLAWDAQQIAADVEAGLDLSGIFSDDEIGVFAVGVVDPPELPDGDRAPFQQMTFTLHDDQAETVKAAIAKARADGGAESDINENSNGNALAFVCASFVHG